MLTIALVTREFPPSRRMGGIGSTMADTARELARRGHRVHVITAVDGEQPAGRSDHDGVTIHRLGDADFHLASRRTPGSILRNRWVGIVRWHDYRRRVAATLRQLIDHEGVQIAEFAEYGAEASCAVERIRDIPIVVRLHGSTLIDNRQGTTLRPWAAPLRWLAGRREMTVARKAFRVTAPSRAVADWYATASGDGRPVILLPNFVDTAFWAPGATRPSDAGQGAARRLLFAGTMTSQKGVLDLVDAVARLRSDGVDAVLSCAGRGGEASRRIEAMTAATPGMSEWLNLLGRRPRESLRDAYAAADVCVLPSWWEVFGMVCLEAMATGALVIAGNRGGMAEIIEHGVDGFLCSPHDPDALARLLRQVLALPPADADAIRARARAKAVARFSAAAVGGAVIAAYADMIQDFQRDRRSALRP